MKILYLLPPSEGKNIGGKLGNETLSFTFEKPLNIATNASEKDLKCTGKRYEQGIELNKQMQKASDINSLQTTSSQFFSLEGEDEAANRQKNAALLSSKGEEIQRGGDCVGEGYLPAISRYSGVMYNAIDYAGMSEQGKQYFENNFGILSGLYGLLRPLDTIGNYKLPIETKGLYKFWGTQITDAINTEKYDYIVDLLPGSYKKMIQWKDLESTIIRIDFYKSSPLLGGEGLGERSGGGIQKISHGVKKIKGEYIKNICEQAPKQIDDFSGEKVQISEKEYHISIISK